MKSAKSIFSTFVLALWISAALIGVATPAGQIEPEQFYFGLEIDGVLCEYSENSVAPMIEEGKALILLQQTTFALLSALGSQFNSEVKLTYHLDPATGRFTYHDSHISQGPAELSSVVRIEGNTARYASTPGEPELSVPVPPEAILENTLSFPHLVRDFVERNLATASYDIFEVREAEVQKSTYTRVGTEPLLLAGEAFDALVLDRLNHKTGLKTRIWLDPATGYVLKTSAAGNRVSYRADPSVVNRIKMANLDGTLCARVGVVIPDVRTITYMKVRATLEPTGLWVTSEGLNVSGQRFTGIINDNLIEGIFEIEHTRYDGVDAPAFPSDFGHEEALRGYLEPEAFIELLSLPGDPGAGRLGMHVRSQLWGRLRAARLERDLYGSGRLGPGGCDRLGDRFHRFRPSPHRGLSVPRYRPESPENGGPRLPPRHNTQKANADAGSRPVRPEFPSLPEIASKQPF
jgi:hypothetical protein